MTAESSLRIFATHSSRLLSNLEYERVAPNTFRHSSGESGVEQFAIVSGIRSSPSAAIDRVDIYIGFRYEPAELFAYQAIVRYGGLSYSTLKPFGKTTCLLLFSVGHFGAWGGEAALSISDPLAANATLERVMDHVVLPARRRVNSPQSLYSALSSNDSLLSWRRSNAAIRAAQVIFLGSMLKIPNEKTCISIGPQLSLIGTQLSDRAPDGFVRSVSEDAQHMLEKH